MFESVSNSVSFPQLEEKVLSFWKENSIYEKSLAQRADAKRFVFFEGPPTANGMPHPGHCLTRAIKDVFPRYRTMRGYLCERKAGWDTHGLPVEVEVCKQLGIHSKEEIENYGIEPFIHLCRESVWRYMKEWEQLTERLGFWLHLEDAYVTYHKSYVESVWWSLKQLFDRGLLYQGHKIVWWWAQGGTALSSGEVGQGYRNVADPSVYVKFPLLDEEQTSLLVWTTTPWTLPSNQFAAVHPELEYALVKDEEHGDQLYVAADLVEALAEKAKRELTVIKTCKGTELLGKRYRPPFDYYYSQLGSQTGKLVSGGEESVGWRVLPADFVTTESGTGLVHQAPAFGEVDHEVLVADQERFVEGDGPELICAVGPDGKFTDVASDFTGQWVKDADKPIIRALKEKELLFHQEQYLHDYPFCWRADQDPLIQYPRKSWFVRTTQFRDRMLENNSKIGWHPEHIGKGRFGNFLESNVDWALSRERYWGTPLPVWVCSETGKQEAIACYDELLSKPGVTGGEVWEKAKAANPDLPDDLMVHKPYIDAIEYDSPFAEKGRMQRVSEVIDCWYDSGAMPFAQWGYPHQGEKNFKEQFPADFISEAIDQTRGWFYSQLAISTMIFGESLAGEEQTDQSQTAYPWPHPFQNCIVLGLMLAEWWESKDGKQRFLSEEEAREALGKNVVKKVGKMSKSLRNYRSPQEIFDVHGADALRWYFFANQAPWNSIIYSERAIKESIPEFLLRLWNVYSFFVIYANMDGFDPADRCEAEVGQLGREAFASGKGFRPLKERGELDRWIISELSRTSAAVVEKMDAYDNYGACADLNAFVDALSNWYVRRSRDRFWSSEPEDQNKLDAYWTLFECLVTTSKLVAPFVPFVAEAMWQNLAGIFGARATQSVHLTDYPTGDSVDIDETLSQQMSLLREIASLGRSARMDAKLKVRQPLAKVEVVLKEAEHQQWLESHDEILKQELNVKSIEYIQNADQYITYQVIPNFKRVGPRVGKLMPAVKKALGEAEGTDLLQSLNESGKVVLKLGSDTIELDNEDIEVRLQAKDGWSAAPGKDCVVVLSTDLTPELIREGWSKDLIRLIQDQRKELDLDYSDRIKITLVCADEELRQAIEENKSHIMSETLCVDLNWDAKADSEGAAKHEINDKAISFVVNVASVNA